MPGNDKTHIIADKWGRIRNLDVCAETEPTQTWPYMMWIQPSTETLKVRNQADDGWISIGGGGGAPIDAQYLVLALDATLTAERRFVDGDGLTLTDGGAGGDATLDVDSTVVRTSGDQTIGGIKTLTNDLVLDDGVGDSPRLYFVAGTNDDTVELRLDDEPTPNTSSFVIVLAGDLRVLSSGHTLIFHTGKTADFTLDNGDLTIDNGDIILNDDHYIGLGDSKGRITFDDSTTPDYIEFVDCHVGIGPSGAQATSYLYIQDTSLECTGYWYGIWTNMTKTGGATDEDDYMHAARFQFTMDDSDSTIGFLRGLYLHAKLNSGTIGTVAANRLLYGIQLNAEIDAGGTINGSLYGAALVTNVDDGTITNDIAGLMVSVDIESDVNSIGDDVFGFYCLTDADKDPTGVVYNCYIVGQTSNNVDYNIFQAGTAPNVFSADIKPATNKTVDLGKAGARWAEVFAGATFNSGTSRLVAVDKLCPVCNTEMVRSTGGLLMTGETKDYQLVFCPACGTVAVEEVRHRTSEEKQQPPKIELAGVKVYSSSGNARSIRVDFRYTDRVIKKKLIPGRDDQLREVDHVADEGLVNSTWLSDPEVAQFLALATDEDRRQFLLALGQREWDSLEEIKQMELECEPLQAAFDDAISNLIYTDLLQGVAA